MKSFFVGCRICKEKFDVTLGPEPRLIRCGCESVIVEVDATVAHVREFRIGASVIIVGGLQVQLTGSVRPDSSPSQTPSPIIQEQHNEPPSEQHSQT